MPPKPPLPLHFIIQVFIKNRLLKGTSRITEIEKQKRSKSTSNTLTGAGGTGDRAKGGKVDGGRGKGGKGGKVEVVKKEKMQASKESVVKTTRKARILPLHS